ncbi:MAG: ATP-binding protein [Syntrophales bacterium]
MERFFNTAGPSDPQKHYCLSPLERIDLSEIINLIDSERYFILHAPRQTGKTTCLLTLMKYLNEEGKYKCLYVNVEAGQAERENIDGAVRAILTGLASNARFYLGDLSINQMWPEIFRVSGGSGALQEVLSRWVEGSDKPVVLFIDEIDALIGDTLISVLRQLRAGYTKRPGGFPQSVILCGLRDIRDYRIHSSREKTIITGGSAFNIKSESLRLGDFEKIDIERLYAQHTEETGQIFGEGVYALVWELTHGQPWLVNALGYEVTYRIKENRDRSIPITVEMIQQAKENLIQRRETHLDQLADKLQEERVRRVIEPMLQGVDLESLITDDDLQYIIDLGLIRQGPQGPEIANPIYREVIPRQLSTITDANLKARFHDVWYIAPDGRIDMEKLMLSFQEFFREHSEHWIERYDYKEAGPQLLLQAFLQRIVNGGGRIEREYGLGRMRTDLLIVWPVQSTPGQTMSATATQKVVIELKILHKSLEKTIADGMVQTAAYMDRTGTEDGHLVIFDRNPDKPWEEKIFRREASPEGKRIFIWGM